MDAELNKLLADELALIVQDTMRYFQNAIERENLVFTAELKQSFENHILEKADVVAAEIVFLSYGRFKDMKVRNYIVPPPIAAIEEYVEKVGLGKFAWIPGYEKSNRVPLYNEAVKRVARAIQNSFVGVPQRRQGKTWYNETVGNMLAVARRRLLNVMGKFALNTVKEAALSMNS